MTNYQFLFHSFLFFLLISEVKFKTIDDYSNYEIYHSPYSSTTDNQTNFVLDNKKILSMEYHEHENRNYQFHQKQQLHLLDNCNFELLNATGIIHSPMFPEKLLTNRSITCIWRIKSTNASKFSAIELNIQVVNLRAWSSAFGNCSDQLTVTYETDSNHKTIIMNPKSRTYPKKIISPKGQLLVNLTICATQSSCPILHNPSNLTANSSSKSLIRPGNTFIAIVEGKKTLFEPKYEFITQPVTGFYANYRLVNCSGCGVGDSICSETHQCDSECGYILSINYPLNYQNNHRCKWLIQAPSQHYINVTVNEFDVPSETTVSKQKHSDCMFDHVSFIDPSTSKLIGRYCNSNIPPKFILSAWNQLLIEFNSDSNVTGRGFSFSYQVQKYQLPSQILTHLKSPSPTACPENYSYYKNHCYQAFFGDQIIQWYDAEAHCAELGAGRNGHLVSILDSNEMSAVFHFLLNVWKSPAYKAFYIGLVDNFKEGSYRWSDSRPMAYTDWAPAQLELDEDEINPPQPDGGAFEDCTIMKFDFGHSTANWHDIPCSLGSHTHVVKSSIAWSNNSDLVNSYICKLDALTEVIESNSIRLPMYKLLKKLNKEAVIKSVSKQRNFVCSNYEVISFLQKCDGVAQCSDNSDEHNCPNKKFILHRHRFEMHNSQQQSNYEINYFSKPSNNRPLSWPFSGFSLPHKTIELIAKSTSDENQACLPEQFKCDSGRCISISYICDYADDCGDNSDEKYCSNVNLLYADRSLLKKNKINEKNLLNQHDNITTYNSKKNFKPFLEMPVLGKNGCLVGEFRCNNGECIPAEKRCDLLIDCKDESDEGSLCSKGNHCNKNYTFQCYYGNCIPIYAICDRHRDCPGKFHEDEQKQLCQQRLSTSSHLSNKNIVTSNYPNQYVAEQSTEVILNHIIFDRLTACRQSKKRTCLDLFLYHGAVSSGRYQVKPENSHFSFEVYCRFPKYSHNNSIIMQNIRTLIHHDSEIEISVQTGKVLVCPWSILKGRPKKNKNNLNSINNLSLNTAIHRRKITYEVGLKSIKALVSDSKQCRQMVHWRCKLGTPVFSNINKNQKNNQSETLFFSSHWVNSEGKLISFEHCLQPNKNGLCTCENHTSAIDFIITDKANLPIREVRFISPNLTNSVMIGPENKNFLMFNNNTNKKNDWVLEGYHLIGPLECEGDSDDIQSDFEDDCKDISNIELFQCQSSQIIKAKQRCIFDHDQYGYQVGCRDVTHLRNCENYICPDDYVKCPNSYCIPPRYICDGKKDCIDGEDEQKCEEFECPGRYKCIESTYCIYLNQLCDGIRQCNKGDDEWFCDLKCPEECECIGLYANCNNRNLTSLPSNLSTRIRKLDLTSNNIGSSFENLDFNTFTRLGELILKDNNIESITSEKFIFLINLYLLDLSNNKIKVLESRAFAGLHNVKTLIIKNNHELSSIEPNAFVGLSKLKHLNISESNISKLSFSAFAGLISLQSLILQSNGIKTIETGSFNDLSELNYLDLRNNKIQFFKQDIFEKLTELKYLHTDSLKFCCLVQHRLPFENCLPLSDEISDCEDLMSSPLQRSFLWILGIIAFIFNLLVIFWRFKKRSHFINVVSSNLLLSLGCADFLMGVYLLIIAIVDQYYRGRYIEVSELWRKSILCKFCGFLSTMSSEASVFTLVAITMERMICIIFPFSKWKFSNNFGKKVILAIWIVTFSISVLPILNTSYFRDEFYSRSGVCLALHITNRKPAGWEYAVALFLVTNLLAFILIVGCYIYMYNFVTKSNKNLTRMISKDTRERQVGKQMAMIVLTDFCCWCPIIILGLLAIYGVQIPASVYSWTAVFILPVNSAVNPIIYTLGHFNLFRKRDSINNKSFYSLKPTGSIQASKNHSAFNKNVTFKAPPGYFTLNDFLKENRDLKMSDLLTICYLLNEQIKQIHASGYAIGKINFHTVFVTNKIKSNNIQVYLPDFYAYRVPNSFDYDDFATDMEDFGILVKKMLQIYHSRLKLDYTYEYRPKRQNENEAQKALDDKSSNQDTNYSDSSKPEIKSDLKDENNLNKIKNQEILTNKNLSSNENLNKNDQYNKDKKEIIEYTYNDKQEIIEYTYNDKQDNYQNEFNLDELNISSNESKNDSDLEEKLSEKNFVNDEVLIKIVNNYNTVENNFKITNNHLENAHIENRKETLNQFKKENFSLYDNNYSEKRKKSIVDAEENCIKS